MRFLIDTHMGLPAQTDIYLGYIFTSTDKYVILTCGSLYLLLVPTHDKNHEWIFISFRFQLEIGNMILRKN